MTLLSWVGVVGVLVAVAGEKVDFTGHHVLRVDTSSEPAYKALVELWEATVHGNTAVDFWHTPRRGVMEMRVEPHAVVAVRKTLEAKGVNFTTVETNLQAALDLQTAGRTPYIAGKLESFDYNQYHPYDEIIDWMRDIHREYPQVTKLVDIGASYHGKSLLAMIITGTGGPTNKPKVWTNYAIHAREWLSPATGIWMMHEMLSKYDTDEAVRKVMDGVEWTFLPVTNPDGYEFSWTTNRMWRKTRSPNSGSLCVGTDPNRNWGYHWGGDGASASPCSDSYRGPSAESEVEVKAVADYARGKGFKAFADVHCCGEMWMTPWAYTAAYPPEYSQQLTASVRCTEALRRVHGTQYKYGTISRVIYVASGSSADFTYGEEHVLHSIAIELPGAFTSPPTIINKAASEMFAALVELGHIVIEESA